jgi:Flp pilus assembly protein TadD
MSLGSTYPVNHREGADQRVRWFQVALGINPTNMGARINLGSALLDLGDLAGAEAQNREAIRLEPNNALSHHNLGWVLYNRGNLSSAEEEYLEAIRLDPNSALSHNNLGLILDRSGNLAAAEIKYREAIRLDPKLAIPHNFLAWLAVRKNDLRLAELEYREALRLDSTYYHSHNGLGWVLEKKGDWDGAETEYRKTIQLEPRYALAHCNLGRMLDRKKVEDGAEVEYRQAIRYDANLKEPHFHLGVLLRQKGDLAGAEAEFRAAIRLDRNDPHPHNSLGYLFQYFTGDLKRAIAEYEEALKLDPMFSAAANNLASAVRMQALLKRLPDILVGKSAPTTPTEACEFASLCRQRFLKRFAAAVRLYDGAFNADTAITSDLIANNRYDAACLAALAARGEGADSPEDAEGRTTLRTKALAWLRAELVHHKKQAISPNITERKAATDALSHWLKDKDFSRLRPTEARIEMSSKERADWDALWIEVRATIAEAPKSGPS